MLTVACKNKKNSAAFVPIKQTSAMTKVNMSCNEWIKMSGEIHFDEQKCIKTRKKINLKKRTGLYSWKIGVF